MERVETQKNERKVQRLSPLQQTCELVCLLAKWADEGPVEDAARSACLDCIGKAPPLRVVAGNQTGRVRRNNARV